MENRRAEEKPGEGARRPPGDPRAASVHRSRRSEIGQSTAGTNELTQQLLGVRSAEVGDPGVKQPTRPDGEREKSAERNPRIRARDSPSLPLPPEIHRQSR